MRQFLVSVEFTYESEALNILEFFCLFQFFEDQELFLNTFCCIFKIIVSLVCYCQFIVKISNIFVYFSFEDLLLNLNSTEHKFFCSRVLLFLSKGNCNSLHCIRFSLSSFSNLCPFSNTIWYYTCCPCFNWKSSRQRRCKWHSACIAISSIKVCKALIEYFLGFIMLICFVIGFSKSKLTFIKCVVIISVDLLSKINSFLAWIKSVMEFSFFCQHVCTFLVEL